MINFKKSCIALTCAMTVLLTACNDSDEDDVVLQPQPTVLYLNETAYTKDTMNNAAQVQVMRYKMLGVKGELVETTAMVMYPKTERPKDGWRAVVWAHGTVGSADSCAPSVNTLNPRFKPLAEDLLAKGYVVIAPDYEGLGTQGIHPYLNLKSAANAMTYAVKAFSEQQGTAFKGDWVSVGQSQGGHASLATAEFAGNDPHYKAAVAAAPASSLGYIIGTIAPTALKQLVAYEALNVVPQGSAKAVNAELLSYAAYVVTGIKAYQPDFDYKALFQEPSKFQVEKAEGTTGDNGLCLQPLMMEFSNDIDIYLQQNPSKTVADYPGLVVGFEKNPIVEKFLAENQPATKKINVPVMIIQGEQDTAVPLEVTRNLQQNLVNLGTDVTFLPVAGAGHTQAIVQKQAELIQFIEKHLPAK